MLKLVLPTIDNKNDVINFYKEFENISKTCIGFNNHNDYDKWLIQMENRKNNINLPTGYVRENFYLCYQHEELVGVFSFKFELTDYLYNYGGNIGYATKPSLWHRGIGNEILKEGLNVIKELGYTKVLLVVDDDNIASIKIIEKNGGILENEIFDEEEKVNVKRYWINIE